MKKHARSLSAIELRTATTRSEERARMMQAMEKQRAQYLDLKERVERGEVALNSDDRALLLPLLHFAVERILCEAPAPRRGRGNPGTYNPTMIALEVAIELRRQKQGGERVSLRAAAEMIAERHHIDESTVEKLYRASADAIAMIEGLEPPRDR
ncbi:hypothetical protein [Variovorax rhizosphaerae]|uniref:Uncharacterized protein n=1 Tax=Variovorax rhizosphaerae TaxID=1836200 RepID=A0ABU8WJJ1_9BURK